MPSDKFNALLADAKTLWHQSRAEEAKAILRELVHHQPEQEDSAMLLAEVLRSQGRMTTASAVVLELCQANDFEPNLCLRGARFCQQCDRHAVAERICGPALTSGAACPAELLVVAGHVARESGDFGKARSRYLAALDGGVDLERNQVLAALANTKRYSDTADPDLARCEGHFIDNAFSEHARASAGFGLGKIQNDLGDYKAAAATLREANMLVHAVKPWDGKAWQRFVAARIHETVPATEAHPNRDFVPVFILGTPRTGTTLTASLLARASGARDRGELRALRFIGEQLVKGGHLGNRTALAEAANLYRTLTVQDDGPATWYLDQDPLNFRWLHIAAAMFPQARVIHLRRDRCDTALSLWSQDFAHPDLAFAYDFEDIAGFMAGHDSLMRHWRQTLSLPIFELDYETLVAEPESTVARLSDFIGAPAVASSTKSGSAPVQSASVWQARQPVYSTSVGRWKHYAPYVPELERFALAEQ